MRANSGLIPALPQGSHRPPSNLLTFAAIEYCEGGSLANLLEHGRIEDEDVILVYALQMLQGLEYLHSKGVEHRDVKPDSEFQGEPCLARVHIDFSQSSQTSFLVLTPPSSSSTLALPRSSSRGTKRWPEVVQSSMPGVVA